jgi:multimeric flavodoxin WrbA
VIDDKVNEFVNYAENFDGFVIGSPVHYASASGIATAFLDRAFFVAARTGRPIFKYKPGTAIASARRAGTTATLDQLNKYFTISGMPLSSSQYWNSVHGGAQGEASEDLEGLQTMRALASNMVFLMKSIALGKEKFGLPEKEKPERTSFVR